MSTRKKTAYRPASTDEITREQQKKKYEFDEKYHAACDDPSQAVYNRYSIRHYYGRYFEHQKIVSIIRCINSAGITVRERKILDVGCHRGKITGLWADLKGTAQGITGADFISEFVQTAKSINPGIHYIQHDVYNPLPKKDLYDIISIVYVYACIPPQDQPFVSEQLARHIAPGGYIILLDFYDSWTVRLRQSLVTLLRRLAGKPRKAYLPRLSTQRVRKLFPGYQVVATRRFMNLWSYPLLRMGTLIHDIVDCFLPGEYYAVMLKKPEQDPMGQ